MSNNCEILASIADNVKAEILYDLRFDISLVKFFRAKFEKARQDEKKLCAILYKKLS